MLLPGFATLNGSVTDDALPVSGVLSVSWAQVYGPGKVTFNNPASANTTASFNAAGIYVVRLTASDGQLTTSDQAAISINLANRAPVAIPQSRATDEDTPLDLTLTGTDADGDPLTFTIVASPIYGQLSGTGPNRRYTPKADFHGSDTLTFKVSDFALESAPAPLLSLSNR